MDIQQQKQLKILVIGDSCEDIYHNSTCERLSPEAPVPILKETETVIKKGMSANVVENLRSFGFETFHITNEFLIEKHRYVDRRFKQHLLRVDWGESKLLDKINIDEVEEIEKGFDAMIISDYDKGFLSYDDCKALCRMFKNIPVFVDSKKTDLTCFSDCVIKINEKENEILEDYPSNYDIIVTLGPKGASYKNKIYDTAQVEVFDICGAGDVFLSALVYNYLLTGNIESAIIFANKCASYSVSKFGTHVLNGREINDLCV